MRRLRRITTKWNRSGISRISYMAIEFFYIHITIVVVLKRTDLYAYTMRREGARASDVTRGTFRHVRHGCDGRAGCPSA